MGLRQHAVVASMVCAGLLAAGCAAAQENRLAALRAGFAQPPDDARVMMRWWWFGPAVQMPELRRELEAMKAAGIGGAELQPVYPLGLDDSSAGFHNAAFLSAEHRQAIRFAADTAHALGLRLSVTLGSGWPYGGATVPVNEAAARLRIAVLTPPAGGDSLALPAIGAGESLLAAFLVPGTPERYDPEPALQLATAGGRVLLPPQSGGARVVLLFIAGRTGQQVKRAAVGAEGYVLDHFSRDAVEHYARAVAEPLVAAFGPHAPDSVFSDSLEVYDADWTPELLQEFRARRGYDLAPMLPLLAAGGTPRAADLRYDWGRTLAELIDGSYLAPLNAWARAHGTRFRSQSYGTPAVTLSSNHWVDLPEGEGSQWRGFSYTRWAASAAHLDARPVVSAETWTSMHSPAFRATPLDLKAAADLFFLQGINQIVGHGWPYSPPGESPGWAFYAAGAYNDHNPWWPVMPEVMSYLQRVSYVLRAGESVNDVAILLPTEDAQARFAPGHVSVTDELRQLIDPGLVAAILDAGFGFDFIDSQAIERVGIHYPVLILPGIERLPVAAYRRIEQYREHGGTVIAVGALPSRVPGLLESGRDPGAVQQLSKRLFGAGGRGVRRVAAVPALAAALRRLRRPDVALAAATPSLGFVHRRLADADLYFIVNTDNAAHTVDAGFRGARRHAAWWNPFTGAVSDAGGGGTVRLALAPYESRLLVFSDAAPGAAPRSSRSSRSDTVLELRDGWSLTFDSTGRRAALETLHSWSDEKPSQFYSGTATYERSLAVPQSWLRSRALVLDFGPGTAVERDPRRPYASRAWLDSPVREAAVIDVNGVRAGSVWHPPYSLDLRDYLHPGVNQLKIMVANTAINALAGAAPADYRLLNLRYGERFRPQDMEGLQALPSGILGAPRLVMIR